MKTDQELRALVRKQSLRLAAQTTCSDVALRRAVAVQSQRLAPRHPTTAPAARPEFKAQTIAASSGQGLMRLLALSAGRPMGMSLHVVMARLAAGGAR